MKEIKTTRTIEEVTGYEANDGKRFSSKEECEKYEQTAEAVINNDFNELFIVGEFPECSIFESFGYGSEEFWMTVIEINNTNDLEIANRYFEFHTKGKCRIDSKYIGKRVLVNIGYEWDHDVNPNPRTYEELVDQFKKETEKYFKTKEEIENE